MAENREMHAMLFSALHLPPMPVIVDMIDRDDNRVIKDSCAESSHSIIATLIDYCTMAISKECNLARMHAQFTLLHNFHEELKNIDLDGPIEPIYNFFCHHTRLWIASYPVPRSGAALFKPHDYVVSGDKIHTDMMGYAKSQLYHHTNGQQTLNTSASVSYLDLLRTCAKWLKEEAAADIDAIKEKEPIVNGFIGDETVD